MIKVLPTPKCIWFVHQGPIVDNTCQNCGEYGTDWEPLSKEKNES